MSKSTWAEIASAKSDNKREIVLSGSAISKEIESNGIDPALFTLININFLHISETCLENIPEDIGKLVNLTNLVLYSNQIIKLPTAIGNLTKLKMLDISRNKLRELPEEITKLSQLSTLNAGSNVLVSFPNVVQNVKLSVLDLSNNELEDFPDICHSELSLLAEVKLNGNKIKEIPGSINNLTSLKLLDLGNNQVVLVPRELSDIAKLKELNLKDNNLKDNRLKKLVDQCRSKQVLDYVRQNCPRASNVEGGDAGSKGKKKGKGKKGDQGESNQTVPEVERLCNKLQVLHVSDETPNVKITEQVKQVRPHIICCIVRGLTFTPDSFKKFIQLQTKLHDTICEKRNAATIATHDLDSLAPGDLTYTARAPGAISIRPLNREKEFSGQALFNKLQHEAEDLRKEKKRNVYSGIHRFLYLLEGKPVYPCLLDSSNRVISFPPITNSDITKVSVSTHSLFIEVTGVASQTVCRKVLDTLLHDMVCLGLSNSETGFHQLTVEQVKVVDLEGNLKVVYPSRADLVYEEESIAVTRE